MKQISKSAISNPQNSIRFNYLFSCLFFTLALVFPFLSHAEYGNPWQMNLIKGVTKVSNDIYDLHMIVVWVSVAIAVGVYAVLFYSIYKHRKSKNPVPAKFHENVLVETAWTVIPLLILIAIAFPATKALIFTEDSSNSDMSIKITGYQWKWQYEYLEQGVSFFSNLSEESRDARYKNPAEVENYILDVDNPLVIPAGKKVRFLITSNDVIHSWWVPNLAVKQDAIPGFINATWTKVDEPGIYRGQCAELCGKDHAYMPVVVEVKSQQDYELWLSNKKQEILDAQKLASQELDLNTLVEMGQKVYNTSCAACHGATGAGIPGVFPALTGSKVTKEDINKHVEIILYGVAGTAMQAFGNQLSDVDIAAVVAYERNALGNSTGDFIQPAAVKALRNK